MAGKRARRAKRMRDFEKWAKRKAANLAANGGSPQKVDDALWLAECGRLHAEADESPTPPAPEGL